MSDGKMAVDSLRKNMLLIVLTGCMSIGGVWLGALLSSRSEVARFARETTFSQKHEILQKRIELLERTVRTVNQLRSADALKASGDWALIEGKDAIVQKQSAQQSMDLAMSKLIKMEEMNGELAALM